MTDDTSFRIGVRDDLDRSSFHVGRFHFHVPSPFRPDQFIASAAAVDVFDSRVIRSMVPHQIIAFGALACLFVLPVGLAEWVSLPVVMAWTLVTIYLSVGTSWVVAAAQRAAGLLPPGTRLAGVYLPMLLSPASAPNVARNLAAGVENGSGTSG